MSPPRDGTPVDGRPIVNLSLAANYAISGLDVWSYHAVNLSIHILVAFVLLGVARRTLTLPDMPARLREAATALATSIALLWAIHPLQTESVTYVSQRAESLVSLFYLLTLYCSIRGASSARPTAWFTEASVRNSANAVDLALEAVQLSGARDPAMLDTLAAAQAEMGRYPEALETAQRAQALAIAKGQTSLADAIEARIKLYRAGSPYHEPPSPLLLPGSMRP